MDQTLQKNGIAILLGVAVMFGLRWISSHWLSGGEMAKTTSYTYEMPRPKSYTGGFDLSDREIDREILLDEETAAKKAADPKAAAEAAKKAEAARKEASKRAAEAAKQAALDRARLTVTSTDTSYHMGELSATPSQTQKTQYGAGPAVVTAASTSPSNGTQPATAEAKKTASEWLALLGNQPTAAVVSEFDSAHAEGDVTNADFYAIAFELLNSSSQRSQQAGTEILQEDNSESALLYLSQQYHLESTADQTMMWKIMVTFAQPTKFQGLNMALASTDTTNVTPLALKVLATAVQEVQQSVTAQSGSGRGVAGSVQPQALVQFETELSQIAKGSTSNAQTAQSLLSQIQSLNQ